MFLRPRKFGKTLFTSVLENYYDKNKKESFEKLYGNTYIGKNTTKLKNSYCILRFNFSGIDTSTEEATIRGFKKEVASSIEVFINRYNLEFHVNKRMKQKIFQIIYLNHFIFKSHKTKYM